MSFTQKYIFFGGTLCVFCIHFSLIRLKTKSIVKEGTGDSLIVILHGWREEMSVFFIFLLRFL